MIANTETRAEDSKSGSVYILENDAMPGLIKIGMTSRDSAERAKELSTTGVPTPFKVAFEVSSDAYENLETEMHRRLADYRVASNREFFRYPVDKAIHLLKTLNEEGQQEPPHLLERASHFFRKFFQKNPQKHSTEGDTPETNQPKSIPTNNNRYARDTGLIFSSTGGKRTAMNDEHGNGMNPNTNGAPYYYSAENGFRWAVNHRGIASCVPQHIKQIIHNEELEIAASHAELKERINYLREDISELEAQKADCEQEIKALSQELTEKKEMSARLEIHSNGHSVNPLESSALPVPTPTETDDEANPELFNMPPDETPDTSAPQEHEELEALIEKKTEIEQELKEKKQRLSGKKIELVGLEIEFQGPTDTELASQTETADDVDDEKAVPAKSRVSKAPFITAIISTIFFSFLAIYLFIFYASAVDKAFFLTTEAIDAQMDDGNDAELHNIVNPTALAKAFQGDWNLFVIMFPFVFLAFAIALDYFWEQGGRLYLVAIGLGVLTLIFDAILAIQISQKLHYVRVDTGEIRGDWAFSITDLNMWTVIFCGFVVSMLVSVMYHVTTQKWKAVGISQEPSEAENVHERKIKSEQKQREATLAVLKAEIENLQNEVSELAAQETATQEKIAQIAQMPIESQLAILNIQMENLENDIAALNQKRTDLEEKIQSVHEKIQETTAQLSKRIIDRNKLELQINQFLNGWCRFVAHNEDGLSDPQDEIDMIKQIASETLDRYYQGRPNYAE